MRMAQLAPPSDVKQNSLDHSECALRLKKNIAEVLAALARIHFLFFGANEDSLDCATEFGVCLDALG